MKMLWKLYLGKHMGKACHEILIKGLLYTASLISCLLSVWKNTLLLKCYLKLVVDTFKSKIVWSLNAETIRNTITGPHLPHPPHKWLFVVQFLSCVQLLVTPWIAACQASLSFTISRRLLKSMSNDSVMPSNHLILCHPLLLLPSIFPSSRVFSNESALHIRWPKYWSFSFSMSPSSEYSGLVSFRMDWFDSPKITWQIRSLGRTGTQVRPQV